MREISSDGTTGAKFVGRLWSTVNFVRAGAGDDNIVVQNYSSRRLYVILYDGYDPLLK